MAAVQESAGEADVVHSRHREHDLLLEIREQKKQLADEMQELKEAIAEIQRELNELDDNSGDEDSEADETQAKVRAAKKEFNIKPKKGLKMLIECGAVEDNPEAIAAMLFESDGLKKGAIGELIGQNPDLWPEVTDILEAFGKRHNFEGLDFDQALRAYLWSFRLPGEAQPIDRLMVAFAKRYMECNPGKFSHEDTCYVLAFSTIMLNTALHNPAVKNKQTIESFISMNRGIDQGKDLPVELLTGLYNSISSSPFKLPEEEAGLLYTFFNPERAGWLHKEGGQHKTWKRRYFTLANNCLYYFESPDSVKPKGTIPLESLHVREATDAKRPHCFEIIAEHAATGKGAPKAALSVKGAKTNRKGQIVLGKHSSYKIQAADRTEMEEWIKCIRAAMQKDPVYEMYRLKKLRVT